jgi:hypothetical protein
LDERTIISVNMSWITDDGDNMVDDFTILQSTSLDELMAGCEDEAPSAVPIAKPSTPSACQPPPTSPSSLFFYIPSRPAEQTSTDAKKRKRRKRTEKSSERVAKRLRRRVSPAENWSEFVSPVVTKTFLYDGRAIDVYGDEKTGPLFMALHVLRIFSPQEHFRKNVSFKLRHYTSPAEKVAINAQRRVNNRGPRTRKAVNVLTLTGLQRTCTNGEGEVHPLFEFAKSQTW